VEVNRVGPARWFRINRVTTLLISLVTSVLILSIAFVPSEPVAAQTSPNERPANNESSEKAAYLDLLRKAQREGSYRIRLYSDATPDAPPSVSRS
jgi:hypothetical protein